MSAVSQTTKQTCMLDVSQFEGTNMVSQCCFFEDGAESLGGVSGYLRACCHARAEWRAAGAAGKSTFWLLQRYTSGCLYNGHTP